ncbi:hypothetical protein [Acinetobacter pullicarnis]|uniref:hypothetical protein n=1 Tax=Acinetobacter pullicarnis TaxID=2576829 RepID=UPI00148EE82F|nr:hypothetical protein [Acinetobacter pullicarnis]
MENIVNYAVLMLKISEYQGPDFILGIFKKILGCQENMANICHNAGYETITDDLVLML